MIDYYDPNIRLGVHTVRVTFMLWDYVGHIAFEVGGNTKGAGVLDVSILEDFGQDVNEGLTENDCRFEISDYDDGEPYFTAVLTNAEGKDLEIEESLYRLADSIVSMEIVKYEKEA